VLIHRPDLSQRREGLPSVDSAADIGLASISGTHIQTSVVPVTEFRNVEGLGGGAAALTKAAR